MSVSEELKQRVNLLIEQAEKNIEIVTSENVEKLNAAALEKWNAGLYDDCTIDVSGFKVRFSFESQISGLYRRICVYFKACERDEVINDRILSKLCGLFGFEESKKVMLWESGINQDICIFNVAQKTIRVVN